MVPRTPCDGGGNYPGVRRRTDASSGRAARKRFVGTPRARVVEADAEAELRVALPPPAIQIRPQALLHLAVLELDRVQRLKTILFRALVVRHFPDDFGASGPLAADHERADAAPEPGRVDVPKFHCLLAGGRE